MAKIKSPYSAAMSANTSVVPDVTFFKTLSNRTPVFAVHTASVNAIRAGDFKAFDKALHCDLNRLNDHYPGGWYGGNNHLLHVAAYFDRADVAGRLLDLGSHLEPVTSFQYTPLMVACVNGNLDTALLLLARGASLDTVDANKRSVRDLMHSSIYEAVMEELRPKTPPPPEVDTRTAEEIATAKSEDERRRIKIKFDEADEDGSGELDAEELAAFCESLGTKLSPDELEAALLILDESGDGQISYEEFAEWWLDD